MFLCLYLNYCFLKRLITVLMWLLLGGLTHNSLTYSYFLPNDYTCKRLFLTALLCSLLIPYVHIFTRTLVVLSQMFGEVYTKRTVLLLYVQGGCQASFSLSFPWSLFLPFKYWNYASRCSVWWSFPVSKLPGSALCDFVLGVKVSWLCSFSSFTPRNFSLWFRPSNSVSLRSSD